MKLHHAYHLTVRQARRLIIFVIGGTVFLIGIAMIVLPGPAILVIPLGLAILATEFVWAKRLLDKVKHHTTNFFSRKKR
jgi:tellurite resistance protein TerC